MSLTDLQDVAAPDSGAFLILLRCAALASRGARLRPASSVRRCCSGGLVCALKAPQPGSCCCVSEGRILTLSSAASCSYCVFLCTPPQPQPPTALLLLLLLHPPPLHWSLQLAEASPPLGWRLSRGAGLWIQLKEKQADQGREILGEKKVMYDPL